MLLGVGLDYSYTTPNPNLYSLVPAQALSAGVTTAFLASNDVLTSSRNLHRLSVVGVPPLVTITQLPDLILGHADLLPPSAKQHGTTNRLASGDQRMQHVVFKSGVGLLMSWTEGCKPPGDTVMRDCSRVVETSDGVGTPVVKVDKELSNKGQYYFYPAATLNSANDIVVGFGVSGSALFPRLAAAVGTPTGTFGPTILLVTGTAPNPTNRYGDYFAVALDPAGHTPNRNVWVAGEIGSTASGDWGSGIREVKVTP